MFTYSIIVALLGIILIEEVNAIKKFSLGSIGTGLAKGLESGLLGNGSSESAPHIALKVLPSKRLKMTRSDMNSLLVDLHHEIRKQFDELEERQADNERMRERTSSTWASNGAPIYVPNDTEQTDKLSPYNSEVESQEIPQGFRQIERINRTDTLPYNDPYRFFQSQALQSDGYSALYDQDNADIQKTTSDSSDEHTESNKDPSVDENVNHSQSNDKIGEKTVEDNIPKTESRDLKNGPIELPW